jgi:hypothetical protein
VFCAVKLATLTAEHQRITTIERERRVRWALDIWDEGRPLAASSDL